MATSRDKYYTEIFNILTDYNRKNMSLSNANIQEAIRKFVEQSSIADANKNTSDTFGHASNTQRENENAIFTSEKLGKSDELVDAVKNLIINNPKYYDSNTATAIDTQGDITRNSETVTHSSNRNELFTHTISGNFEQKLLSSRNIPVLSPAMNSGI